MLLLLKQPIPGRGGTLKIQEERGGTYVYEGHFGGTINNL